jgi:hypothetical protein
MIKIKIRDNLERSVCACCNYGININVVALSILFLFCVFLLSVLIIPHTITNGQTEVEDKTERTQIFGCQRYPKLMHCDPLLNKFDSYRMEGSFSKVYQSNRQDPLFTTGRYDKGLELHDGYRE